MKKIKARCLKAFKPVMVGARLFRTVGSQLMTFLQGIVSLEKKNNITWTQTLEGKSLTKSLLL